MTKNPAIPESISSTFAWLSAVVFALFLLSAGARAQQPSQDEPAPVAQEPLTQALQNSRGPGRPPNAHHLPQDSANPEIQSVPPTLIVPAGTVLLVRINELLSSDQNRAGDEFTAVLQQPVVVNGWVVARRGQVVIGRVELAQRAGRIKGVSRLGITLTDLTLVDGQQVPVLTQLWQASGGTSHGQDAATIGIPTALGATIGAAADWGRGAAIGAAAGAAAGVGAVLMTRGHPTVLEPETQLTFRVVDPVQVNTTQSQQAFRAVSQADFQTSTADRWRHRRPFAAYPVPAPYPWSYYYPYYAYPGYFPFHAGFVYGFHGHHGHHGFHH